MSSNHTLLKYLLSLQSWPEEESVVHLKISVCSFFQRTSSLQNVKRWASELRAKAMILVIADLVTAAQTGSFPWYIHTSARSNMGSQSFLLIMGWARQFNYAQSSSWTSAQSMPRTSSETQGREQQIHACTSSQSLVFLLLKAQWQGCKSRAKIGCTKNLAQEPILCSLPVCCSPVLWRSPNSGVTQLLPHWKHLGNGWFFSVVLGKFRKPAETGKVLLDALQTWPVTAHASDAPCLSRQDTWRAGSAANSSCQSPVFMWNSWLSFKIIMIIIKKSDLLSWKYDP